MNTSVRFRIGAADPIGLSGMLERSIPDVQGSYTIPYIQSSTTLKVRACFAAAAPGVVGVRVTLRRDAAPVLDAVLGRDHPEAVFSRLAPAEYTLGSDLMNGAGEVVQRGSVNRIGVGCVLAAIGDSITEGYHGYGFKIDDLDLRGGLFPCSAVSRDGRNFPQFAPTAATYKPDVTCFQSWLTDLNDKLGALWKQPVFIANEGWGGATVPGYMQIMETDNWQERIRGLQPTVWLIHLGVNDSRSRHPADRFEADLRGLVQRLCAEYAAVPERIYLACPAYDYWPRAAKRLAEYGVRIRRLQGELGTGSGPDFFAAFGENRAAWYGEDMVHPTILGMRQMAKLWAEALDH